MSTIPRLGVSQRVEVVESYGERRDCLDQAWTGLLEEWGYQPVPLPNTVEDAGSYLDSMAIDGIVLTGGNDIADLDGATQPAPERDQFERAAVEWAIQNDRPICGVCRGLQLLNTYFGGQLSTVSDHVATEHTVSFQPTVLTFENGSHRLELPETVRTNSYHGYGIGPNDLADPLQAVGTAADGTVEMVVHPDLQLVGIMWHPERDGPSTEINRKLFDALFRGTEQ